MQEQNIYTSSSQTQDDYFSRGSLVVICGSMCCGKTEEIIRIVGRQMIIDGSRTKVFKPKLDNRKLDNQDKDPSKYVTSRNGSSIACLAVNTVDEMAEYIHNNNIHIIAIDEAQFFDKENFIQFTQNMLALGKKLIIAGLDLDFKAEPFGAMGHLLACADNVIKLTAICKKCGHDTYCISQRLIDGQPAHYNDPLISVGANQYEPRCRKCHIIRKD
jgi:thymidine kinase